MVKSWLVEARMQMLCRRPLPPTARKTPFVIVQAQLVTTPALVTLLQRFVALMLKETWFVLPADVVYRGANEDPPSPFVTMVTEVFVRIFCATSLKL